MKTKKAKLRYFVEDATDNDGAPFFNHDRQKLRQIGDSFTDEFEADRICRHLNEQEKTLKMVDKIRELTESSKEAMAAAKEFRATVVGLSDNSTKQLVNIIDRHMLASIIDRKNRIVNS